VLAGDGDVGGLIGIHFAGDEARQSDCSRRRAGAQGIDFIDIGEMLESSGAGAARRMQVADFSGVPAWQEWKKEAAEAAT